MSASANRVFISCVSDEFERPTAPFPHVRGQLRHYLTRAECEVKVQEDFRQTGDVDTVEKLDRYIRTCAAVIHLVGAKPGATADAKAVRSYLAAEPAFLANHPDLRAALGDCSDLTYTQWEAFLALHHAVPLFVYATADSSAQQTHLDRLVMASKYASVIEHPADLLGQLIGDIHEIIRSVPKLPKIASSRILRHSPPILFGREAWLDALDEAWTAGELNLYVLVAWGGVGKTSLVAHWVAERLMKQDWPGVERYFDWSFYSQGTGESRQTSADLFLSEALKFFDDPDPTQGGPWERGERLARLVRQHRTLLVLDGIEPLQYPPNDRAGLAGRLKDPGLEALVQGLAADNPGLCLVTTREHLKNVEALPTTREKKLDQLLKEAAVALLRHLQIAGTDAELAAAWRDAGGHALTLQLLGRFIADAYPQDRDIRHYKRVKFAEADRERQGRSAFKVMIAYEQWLKSAGPERQRELALLRLTGLFDRPISSGCLQALRAAPAIAGLTDALVVLKETEWNIALQRLVDVDLLSRSGLGSDVSIDAHPLVREYFAEQLQSESPEAWRAAHRRLYEYLCTSTKEGDAPTLEELQPLYQAVAHGCQAGLQQEANDNVFFPRIRRRQEVHSLHKIGAFGSDLGAIACFFEQPWNRASSNLNEYLQSWYLYEAAYCLRALGRLIEALEPMRAALEMRVKQEDWENSAAGASNLSELELTLGEVAAAEREAEQSVIYADRSGDAFHRLSKRTTHADALHQAGRHADAEPRFREAERMQQESEPESPLLYSLLGFKYCDLLLAAPERAAWQVALSLNSQPSTLNLPASCLAVSHRAAQTLQIAKRNGWLLDIALDNLTLGRAALYTAILKKSEVGRAKSEVEQAVTGLRRAGTIHWIPAALLTRALLRFLTGPESAQADLDAAWEIAERGSMKLHMADIHLYRARLFFREPNYPWNKHPNGSPRGPKDDLAAAEKLIHACGYHRRDEELADAKAVIAP